MAGLEVCQPSFSDNNLFRKFDLIIFKTFCIDPLAAVVASLFVICVLEFCVARLQHVISVSFDCNTNFVSLDHSTPILYLSIATQNVSIT